MDDTTSYPVLWPIIGRMALFTTYQDLYIINLLRSISSSQWQQTPSLGYDLDCLHISFKQLHSSFLDRNLETTCLPPSPISSLSASILPLLRWLRASTNMEPLVQCFCLQEDGVCIGTSDTSLVSTGRWWASRCIWDKYTDYHLQCCSSSCLCIAISNHSSQLYDKVYIINIVNRNRSRVYKLHSNEILWYCSSNQLHHCSWDERVGIVGVGWQGWTFCRWIMRDVWYRMINQSKPWWWFDSSSMGNHSTE